MPGMNQVQLNAFLDSDVLCRLACLDEDGHPYAVPCWFLHAEGGFYVVARERSAWAAYLQRDARVSLCIDADDGRRVLVKGLAELIERPNVGGRWVEIARKMALRYRGEAGLDYLERSLNEPRWLFFVEPEKMYSWLGGGWAQRYKHYRW